MKSLQQVSFPADFPTGATYDPARGRRHRARIREIKGLLLSAPFWVGFLLLGFLPMVASLYLSLCHYSVLTAPIFRGLGNYIDMWSDPGMLRATRNTLVYAVLSIPIGLILGLALAILLNQKVKLLTIWRTLFYLPAVLPATSAAVLWRWMLNKDYGILNAVLVTFGLPRINWLSDERWLIAAYVFFGLWGIGAGMIVNLAGLQSIPTDLYDAAEVDGAGRVQKLRAVTLPMMSPVIFYNLIVSISTVLQSFAFFFALTQTMGANVTYTETGVVYMVYLYRVAFELFRMGYASSMAWTLFFAILGLTLLLWHTAKSWVFHEAEWVSGR